MSYRTHTVILWISILLFLVFLFAAPLMGCSGAPSAMEEDPPENVPPYGTGRSISSSGV